MARKRERLQYLEYFKASRGPRKPGEVFFMKFRGKGYVFGRVVVSGCALGASAICFTDEADLCPSAHLVYIYRPVYRRLTENVPFRVEDLLIPPVITLTGWSSGCFVPMRVDVPDSYERLSVHCFSYERFDHRKGQEYLKFCDERGKNLSKCYQPCGRLGPFTHRGIEKLVAQAHGWPVDYPL